MSEPSDVEDREFRHKQQRGAMRGRYGGIIAALIAGTVAAGIYAMAQEGFLNDLASEDNIRAFLAFIFGFGTIIMVFLGVLFIVFADDEDYKERFDGIKYIFSILIAVLGTITGFYFGQSTVDQQTVDPQNNLPAAMQEHLPGPEDRSDDTATTEERTSEAELTAEMEPQSSGEETSAEASTTADRMGEAEPRSEGTEASSAITTSEE